MAELNDKPDQAEQNIKKTKHSKTGLWFGVFIIFVVLLITAIGFYFYLQLSNQQQDLGGSVNKGDLRLIEMSKQITGFQNQLAALQTQLSTMEAEIENKDSQYHKQINHFSNLHEERLNNLEKNIGDKIQLLERQLGKTRGDWLIADAEYLLSIATQRLQLIGDVETTREALLAADQRLRESGDSGVFKVREQISKDIAALKNLSSPDIVGMYSTAQTLQDQVKSLALIKPYAGKKLTPSKEIHDHTVKTDESHDLLDKALKQLEGVVTIRHLDQDIKHILTPEEAEFIRQQLRVKLEMVKVAIVQQNESLYQSSLRDAKSWLLENFTKNDDARNFISELDRLSKIRMESQYPDISLSLKILRDIVKLRIEADQVNTDQKKEPDSGPELNSETAQ